MKKLLASLVCLLLTVSLLTPSCLADGGNAMLQGAYEAAESAEHDGYIVKLTDGAAMDAEAAGLKEFADELYTTDDISGLAAAASFGLIDYIEPDFTMELCGDTTVADTSFDWAYKAMHAQAAWDAGLDGTGVKIAVIDSGVDVSNADLTGALIDAGYNVAGTDTADITDSVGHGTAVTEMIVGRHGDGVGVSGIAPGAEILPIKCTTSLSFQTSALVAGIDKAVELGCDIINMSISASSPDALNTDTNRTLRTAVSDAYSGGILMVSAVGNYGNSNVYYPAGFDNVIGVGAVDSTLTIASYSCFSSATYVCAPGTNVVQENGTLARGTSFATPCVAGAAALLLQKTPDSTPADIMEVIKTDAAELGETGWDKYYGWGFVDIALLLNPVYAAVDGTAVDVFWRAGTPLVVAAQYTSAGQLLSSDLLTGAYKSGVTLQTGCASVKVMALSADYLPTGDAVTLAVSS